MRTNVNTASADELARLDGVRAEIAHRIVGHRERRGPFATVDELGDVDGIGPATVARLRGQLATAEQPVVPDPGDVRPVPFPPEIEFASWNDFKSRFVDILFGNESQEGFARDRFLFRGHSTKHWRLEPTFDRMFASNSAAKRLEIARDLLDEFRSVLLTTNGTDASLLEDEHQLLALGQHYGLPTRLLDWTENPYIAAFFAYNNAKLLGIADQQIAIWVLDARNPIWSAEYGVAILDVPYAQNDRIRNQRGKFTWSKTPFASLEDYAGSHGYTGGEDDWPLCKFLLPSQDSSKALNELDAMGINHATVYPETEGAAQAALFRTVIRHQTHVEAPTSRPT